MLVWGVLSSLREGVHDLQGGGRGALQRCMGEKNTLVSNFLKYVLHFEEKHRLNEKFQSHPFEVVLRGRRHLTKCFVLAISRRGWLTLQEI